MQRMQRNGVQILPLFSWGKSHFLFKMLREVLDFSVRTNSTVNTWTFEIEFLMFSLSLSLYLFFFVFCFYVWKKNYTQLVQRSFEKVWGSSSWKKGGGVIFHTIPTVSPLAFIRPYTYNHTYIYIRIYTHMRRRKKRGLSVTVGPIFHVRYPVAGFSFLK